MLANDRNGKRRYICIHYAHVYRGMTNPKDKKKFLDRFYENGKGKDMSFLQTYTETVTNVNDRVAKTSETFYTANQILTTNAFNPDTMDDQKKKR